MIQALSASRYVAQLPETHSLARRACMAATAIVRISATQLIGRVIAWLAIMTVKILILFACAVEVDGDTPLRQHLPDLVMSSNFQEDVVVGLV